MGGLVEVKPGGAAEGLSVTADSAVASVDETTELRKAVAKAHSPASWDSTETGGGAAGTTEGGDQSSFVLVFLLSGAVLWFAWRRAPGHQRS